MFVYEWETGARGRGGGWEREIITAPPVWWLWQTGWCVLLYQQVTDSQRVREKERYKSKKKKAEQSKTRVTSWVNNSLCETDRRKLEEMHTKLKSVHNSIEQLVKPILAILIRDISVPTLTLNITIRTIMSMKVVNDRIGKKNVASYCVTHMQFMPWCTIGGKVM